MHRLPPTSDPYNPFDVVTVLDALDTFVTATVASRHNMGIEERTSSRILAARLRYYAETIDVTIGVLPESRDSA